jgi:AraC family transcriptional regulator
MLNDTQSRQSYYERIDLVKRYIRQHLDESLDREGLAAVAGFSVPHFHRIFTALVGESIASYVRRVRMERAGWQLQMNTRHITEIALDAGYETHAAFGKAFKQHFGISPSAFRQLNQAATAMILHERALIVQPSVTRQPHAIRCLPDLQILYARASEIKTDHGFHTAPAQAFSKLIGFIQAHGLTEQVRHYVALYPDEPIIGQAVRFDAGAIFAEGMASVVGDGLAYHSLSAGRWAVFRHIGPYETLWRTWFAIYGEWLPMAAVELRDLLPFDDYVDNAEEVQPEALRTEIYIPIV